MSRLDQFGGYLGDPQPAPFSWPELSVSNHLTMTATHRDGNAVQSLPSAAAMLSGGMHIPALAAAPLLRFWEPLRVTTPFPDTLAERATQPDRDCKSAHTSAPTESEGRIALFVRLLHESGNPIMSRDQAIRYQLLAEWDHLGRLCVCREQLLPIPRWKPWGSPRSSSDTEGMWTDVHFIAVEFADGFRTLLQRDEVRLLPVFRTNANR